ncbi:MAG: sensor histidine kinase [Bacteroidia bacterium]
MRFKNYIGIVLLLFFTFESEGQQLIFNNISNQLGLPAQESYNVMQDSKGYIWISTEAGLCRYNGSYCKVFSKKNGLPENSCYAVSEDNNRSLWILSSANRVLQYIHDSLKESVFSKNFSSQLKKGLSQAYNLSFINDSIIISTQNASYICAVNSSTIRTILPDTTCGYYFLKSKNFLINIKSYSNVACLNRLAAKGILSLDINTGKEIKQIVLEYKSKEQPTWRVLTAANKKGESFIAFGKKLLKLNADYSYAVYELPADIVSLYCDAYNGLWIGTIKSGVHYYADTDDMNNKTVSLEGYSVTGICVDKENGVWCSTLEKGVFYSRNKSVINYANNADLNKPADLLKYEGGKLFISTGNNKLIEFEKENIFKYNLKFSSNDAMTDILKRNDGWVVSGKNNIVETNNEFSSAIYVKNTETGFYAGASQLSYLNDKKLVAIHYGVMLEIIDDKAILIKDPLESGGRCLQYIGDHVLLYGCKDGLYKMFVYNNTNTNYVTKKIKGIEGTVTKIIKTSANEVWVATKENGIYIYKGDSVINMTSALKLPTDRFFDITEDRFGNIWLGGNVGLIKVISKRASKLYTTLNGLPSNEIYKVAADSNFIYLSGTEGISRFPLNMELSNTAAPDIYLNSLKVRGTLVSGKDKMSLSYNDNSLKLELDALTFKETGNPTLFYGLKGLNEKTFKTDTVKGNIISLDNLPPDAYELSVFAVNNDGVKSIKPVLLNFEVQKPYWQSIFFILGCIVCFILIVFITVKQIIKRIQKKEEEKTKVNKQLAEFQLTALQAQMNPHFIFNAINSIQNYILKKKEQEAYNYLAKFSKLIRMVLTNSEQKTLSLYDELEMVKLYVELEQLRFKKNFEFKLDIADAVEIHRMQIPSMLIQPYIENAIWHGLMNMEDERKGILSIHISIENQLLKIVIEDNGIGREQAAKYKNESVHKSVAMKLTEKRLMMINTMTDYVGANVLVSDLKDKSGNTCGTRVVIYLPI